MESASEIVRGILDEIQKSSSAQKAGIRKLQGLVDENSSMKEEILLNLFQCFDCFLVCPKKEPASERVLKFFSSFIASSGDESFRTGIEYLLYRSQAVDKTVRYRALQAIAAIFAAIPGDREIAQDLWEKMREGN